MKSRSFAAALIGGALLVAGAVGAWTSASEGAGAGVGVPGGPLSAARYELTVDGHSIGLFSDLEGIVSGYERDELETAGHSRKGKGKGAFNLPGKRTPPAVTLKRGMSRNIEMSAWHELVLLGDVAAARKDVTLTMYDTSGDPIVRYHLTAAWPSKLEIGALSAGASQALYETVTLSAAFIRRVSV